MRNRIHGSGTMQAPKGGRKEEGTSLNLTAHINSRERVSFRRYKSGPASKGVSPDVPFVGSIVVSDSQGRSNETIIDDRARHGELRCNLPEE